MASALDLSQVFDTAGLEVVRNAQNATSTVYLNGQPVATVDDLKQVIHPLPGKFAACASLKDASGPSLSLPAPEPVRERSAHAKAILASLARLPERGLGDVLREVRVGLGELASTADNATVGVDDVFSTSIAFRTRFPNCDRIRIRVPFETWTPIAMSARDMQGFTASGSGTWCRLAIGIAEVLGHDGTLSVAEAIDRDGEVLAVEAFPYSP